MMHSVVVVDDHTLLSQAIGAMVNTFTNFKVLYACKNGQELTEKFTESPENIPDIVLMDINMPMMNGIETTEWIVKKYPYVNVMALSVEDEDKTILQMLRAGAIGYLLKDTEKSILEHALVEVTENGFYHTKNVTNLLVRSMSGKEKPNTEFKKKEIIFMKLACTELTYKEIAEKMNLSPKTIDGYRDHLFSLLGVRNRVGLVMYAVRNRIYTP